MPPPPDTGPNVGTGDRDWKDYALLGLGSLLLVATCVLTFVCCKWYTAREYKKKKAKEEEKAQAKADALQANQLRDLEASPPRILPKSPARQHRSASAA